jgi:hypothetical protein
MTVDPNVTGGQAIETMPTGPNLGGVIPGSRVTSTSSSGSRSSSASFSYTPRESANSQLDQMMFNLFGRRATAGEKANYYKQLSAAEKRYGSTSRGRSGGSGSSTSTTDATGNTTSSDTSGSASSSTSIDMAFDKQSFLFEYSIGLAQNYIKKGQVLGGQAGKDYQELQDYSRNMGLTYSQGSLLNKTISSVVMGKDVVAMKQEMRDHAVNLYPSFSDFLKSNKDKTIRDAVDQYVEVAAQMFDVPSTKIDLNDKAMQKLLNAQTQDGKPYLKNKVEFMNDLRDDSRFQYGSYARAEAKDLASGLARAMGFGA